jgi:hypothetical protein
MKKKKFKVGDKVRRIDDREIYTVAGCNELMLMLNESIQQLNPNKFELVEPQFKRGDKVLVRDSNNEDWDERIFLTEIKGGDCPYIVVNADDEVLFHSGYEFAYTEYVQIKPLPQVEEMTLEEVCKELGREIKIVE